MKIGNGNHYNDIPFFTKDKVTELSSKLDNKVLINGNNVEQVEVKHISRDEYYNLVNNN
jgi:hypothetical protein